MEDSEQLISGEGFQVIDVCKAKIEQAVIRGHIRFYRKVYQSLNPAKYFVIPSGETVKVEEGTRVFINETAPSGNSLGWSEALFLREGEITGPAKVALEKLDDFEIAWEIASRSGVLQMKNTIYSAVPAFLAALLSAGLLNVTLGVDHGPAIIGGIIVGFSILALASYLTGLEVGIDADHQDVDRVISLLQYEDEDQVLSQDAV